MSKRNKVGTGSQSATSNIVFFENALSDVFMKRKLANSQSSNSTDSTAALKLLPMNKSQLSKLTNKTSSPSPKQLQATRHQQQNQHPQKSQSSLGFSTSQLNCAANSKLSHKTSFNQLPNRNLPTTTSFNQPSSHHLEQSQSLQKSQSKSKLPQRPSTSSDSNSSVSSTGTQLPKRNLPVIVSSDHFSQPLVIRKPQPSTPNESILAILNLIRDGQRQILEDIKELQTKIDNIEKKSDENYQKLLRNARGTLKGKPDFLPFKTLDDVKKFELCDESTYKHVFDYFRFLGGGVNLQGCTSRFLKESLDCNKELLDQLTWVGQGAEKNGLKNTKIIKACHAAARAERNIPPFTQADFEKCMEKSLRSLKEQLRRNNIKTAAGTIAGEPPRKKIRRRSRPDDGLDTRGDKIDEDQTHENDKQLYNQEGESEDDDRDEQQQFFDGDGNGEENEGYPEHEGEKYDEEPEHEGQYYNGEVSNQLINYDSEDMTTQNTEYVNNLGLHNNNGMSSDEEQDFQKLLKDF